MAIRGTPRRLAIIALLIPSAARADGQGAVQRGAVDGLVTDTALAPIRDAVVSLEGVNTTLITGPNGRFRFLALPPGFYEVRVRKLGFAPTRSNLEVMSADTNRIVVTLQPSVVMLDSVRVAVFAPRRRLDEFEERRAHGDGQYLTSADIERRNSMNVLDLVTALKGVGRTPDGRAINKRFGVVRTCQMQVFIDDVLVAIPSLETYVSPNEIAGIEVYVSIASVPLRYKAAGNASACGVILLWTKRGH
jgi:iron complex outermembrane receptor protein